MLKVNQTIVKGKTLAYYLGMEQIENIFLKKLENIGARKKLQDTTLTQLSKMKEHDFKTYLHEIRVALIAEKLAEYCGFHDTKPEFFGGANHDAGKLNIEKKVLTSTNITSAEYEKIKEHAENGREALKAHLFTSTITGSHHSHQKNGYGMGEAEISALTISDVNKTRLEDAIINVSMADYYDASKTRGTGIVWSKKVPKMEEVYPNYADRINYLVCNKEINDLYTE